MKNKILFIIFSLFILSVFNLSFAQEQTGGTIVSVDNVNVETPQPSFWQRVGNSIYSTMDGLRQGAEDGIKYFYSNDTPGPGVPNKAVGDKTPIFTAPNGSSGNISGSSFSSSGSSYRISCNASSLKTVKDVILNLVVGCVLNPLVYIIIGLAVVVFLWGVIKFVISESDGDKQKGKEFILWGIVGLFVMVSIWGLENILASTFNLNNSNIQVKPINSTLNL